jgi:hypothetical protein
MKRAIKIILFLLVLSSCSKDGLLNNKREYLCTDNQGNDEAPRWMTEKQAEKYQEENNCSCYAQ